MFTVLCYASQMNLMLLQQESACQPSLILGLRLEMVTLHVKQFSSLEAKGRSNQPKSGTCWPPRPLQSHRFSSSMSLPAVQYSWRDLAERWIRSNRSSRSRSVSMAKRPTFNDLESDSQCFLASIQPIRSREKK